MTTATASPITSTDRLGLTLFFAVVVHALIILGITFIAPDEKPADNQPTLEIILATRPATQKITNPDFLAQAHQEGGGTQETRHRPTAPPTVSTTPSPLAGNGPTNTSTGAAKPAAAPAPTQITTTRHSQQQATPEIAPPSIPTEAPSAADMMMRSREIAKLSAELSSSMQAYARRPKHRYIAARTAEFRDAAYMAAWQAKIEMIGNLNYPEEARRRNISGNLRLDVAINPDGSVNNISVLRSSGHKLLDDAAIRIVRLAAPFGQMPLEMRKETDILHIIRTWQFLDKDGLVTGQ